MAHDTAGRSWAWTGRRTVILLALVVMVGTAGIVLTRGERQPGVDGIEWSRPSPTPPRAEQLDSARTAPDGGRFEVVERGFTQHVEYPGFAPVMTAVVVRNTSTSYAAVGGAVTLRYLDAKGVEIETRTVAAPTVGPGHRGVVRHRTSTEGRVSRVEAEISWPGWGSPRQAELLHAEELTAGPTTVVATGNPRVTILRFTARNAGRSPVLAAPFAVFRDSTGRLLGADTDPVFDDMQYLRPGESQAAVVLSHWRPPNADLSRTEVQLDHGKGI